MIEPGQLRGGKGTVVAYIRSICARPGSANVDCARVVAQRASSSICRSWRREHLCSREWNRRIRSGYLYHARLAEQHAMALVVLTRRSAHRHFDRRTECPKHDVLAGERHVMLLLIR